MYEDTNDVQYADLLRLLKKDVNRTLPESYLFRDPIVQKSMIRVLFIYSLRLLKKTSGKLLLLRNE